MVNSIPKESSKNILTHSPFYDIIHFVAKTQGISLMVEQRSPKPSVGVRLSHPLPNSPRL